MLLMRETPNPFEDYNYSTERPARGQHEHNYTACPPSPYGSEWQVETRFDRFGSAKYRRPDFAVYVTWTDVENILETLCKAGCPEALALQDARKLAKSLEELGWHRRENRSRDANAA